MHQVYVLDDHVAVREGVRRLIRSEWPTIDAVLFSEPRAALEAVEKASPDLMVMDWTMPGCEGTTLIKDLRAISPGLRILVYSMHAASAFGVQAMRAGASGYVSKDAPPEELIDAIRRLSQGKRFVSEDLGDALAVALMAPGEQPHESLSAREMQVLLELARGHSITDISAGLNLSVKTVSTYKARLLEKMGAKSVADLVRYAMNHNLL